MIVGIILAAGEGTRIDCKTINKTVLPFNGKLIIQYGVDLFQNLAKEIIVLVGAFSKSVKQALKNQPVHFAYQKKRLGTGHAAKIATEEIAKLKLKPTCVLIGYADHMMFYSKKVIKDLIKLHKKEKAALTLISTRYHDPNHLAWGRIIRNSEGYVEKIIEQKDATKEERKVKEVNAGFYCFDYDFLKNNIDKIEKSPVSGEYYLPDMVKIARQQGLRVATLVIRFRYVGIGVNTREQLTESKELYKKLH